MRILEVLKVGQSLEDPANWKRVQVYASAVLFVAGMIAQFAPLPLTEGQLNAISYACGVVLYLVNTYLTFATTKKIGSQ